MLENIDIYWIYNTVDPQDRGILGFPGSLGNRFL